MTITTEALRKLLEEATQDDFPTARHEGKTKLDKISVSLAAELSAARAKIEAADALYCAVRDLLKWDMGRGFLVPYRVRDPIHKAFRAIEKSAQ